MQDIVIDHSKENDKLKAENAAVKGELASAKAEIEKFKILLSQKDAAI